MADTTVNPENPVADAEAAAEALARVKAEIGKAVFGQEKVVELSLAAGRTGPDACGAGTRVAARAAGAVDGGYRGAGRPLPRAQDGDAV